MKKIIWVIAIVIIISFGFFGTASLLRNRGRIDFAGKIFGKKVSFDEFRESYKEIYIQAMIRYQDSFHKIKEYLNLESETWDRMILLHEAKRRKIIISDEEVIAAIQKYPFFQKEGIFDKDLYENILRLAFRLNPRDFEETVRNSLKIGKIVQKETSSVNITDEQAFKVYQRDNEKVQVSFVLITPEPFEKDVPFEESLAQEYYQDHKIEFMSPATINVDFVGFPYPPLPAPPEADEESNPEEDPDIDREVEIEQMQQNAFETYQQLLSNPNITEVAAKNNLEVQTSGFFSIEQPNLTLGWSYDQLSVIFQLEQDQVSEPFETPNGVYIVKVKEKKEAFIPPYADTREKVKEAFLKAEARKIAEEKTQEYLTTIQDDFEQSKIKDFPKIAKNLNLQIYQTPTFTRGQYLPVVGIAKEFQKKAFELTDKNPISEVVETTKGYCILHRDTYLPADEKKYEEEKVQFKETLLRSLKNEAFNDFLTQLRLEARLEDFISKEKK